MNNRRKGHNLERYWAKWWREWFPYSRTTRSESRLLDNCGIDLTNIPFFWQSKNGYEKSYPKYDVEYNYIKTQLGENFPAGHYYFDVPIILNHKLPGAGPSRPEKHYVSMDFITFQNLLSSYYEMKETLTDMGIDIQVPYTEPIR